MRRRVLALAGVALIWVAASASVAYAVGEPELSEEEEAAGITAGSSTGALPPAEHIVLPGGSSTADEVPDDPAWPPEDPPATPGELWEQLAAIDMLIECPDGSIVHLLEEECPPEEPGDAPPPPGALCLSTTPPYHTIPCETWFWDEIDAYVTYEPPQWGRVRANPVLGIVGLESWFWVDGLLAGAHVMTGVAGDVTNGHAAAAGVASLGATYEVIDGEIIHEDWQSGWESGPNENTAAWTLFSRVNAAQSVWRQQLEADLGLSSSAEGAAVGDLRLGAIWINVEHLNMTDRYLEASWDLGFAPNDYYWSFGDAPELLKVGVDAGGAGIPFDRDQPGDRSAYVRAYETRVQKIGNFYEQHGRYEIAVMVTMLVNEKVFPVVQERYASGVASYQHQQLQDYWELDADGPYTFEQLVKEWVEPVTEEQEVVDAQCVADMWAEIEAWEAEHGEIAGLTAEMVNNMCLVTVDVVVEAGYWFSYYQTVDVVCASATHRAESPDSCENNPRWVALSAVLTHEMESVMDTTIADPLTPRLRIRNLDGVANEAPRLTLNGYPARRFVSRIE